MGIFGSYEIFFGGFFPKAYDISLSDLTRDRLKGRPPLRNEKNTVLQYD